MMVIEILQATKHTATHSFETAAAYWRTYLMRWLLIQIVA